MISKEEILKFVSQNGPSLISDIVSKYNSDSFMVGALLSELKKEGKVTTSNLRVGSSPLYYKKEDHQKLENFTDNLHSKEKTAYDLIKEEKVIREEELDPPIRVAIKNIKDFAKPLEVKINNNKIIFYKFYNIDTDTAKKLISKSLKSEIEKIKKQREPKKEDKRQKEENKEKQKEEKKEEKKEQEKQEEKEKKEQKKKQEEQKDEEEKQEESLKKSSDISEILNKIKKDDLLKDVIDYVFSNAELVTIESMKKPIRGIIKLNSKFGKIKYFFVIQDRKKVTKANLYESISLALNHNLPCMIIANKVSKTTKKRKNWEKFHNILIIDNESIE
ncbi:MAG: hypothetical protein ACOCRX_02105 [Candidatus Woesearchaeota archaeon]